MNKIFTYTFIILIISFLFYRCFLKEEINCGLRDTIEQRHELIDSLYNQIDSLYNVIDTLNMKMEIIDYDYLDGDELLSAIMMVESRKNDSAHAINEDAVGCLQIRKTMVDDVNRILKRKGFNLIYTYKCRWNRKKSIEMFNIFCDHYNLDTAEEIARCWNGGPRGINNPATVKYWEKVQGYINS